MLPISETHLRLCKNRAVGLITDFPELVEGKITPDNFTYLQPSAPNPDSLNILHRVLKSKEGIIYKKMECHISV